MTRIVLASRNEGKLKELQTMLADTGITLLNMSELDIDSPPETGLTFIENALIKARAVSAAADLPAIADDSGLVVPALGGAPGIHSARYAGRHGDDNANNARLIRELSGVTDRRAYFYCALVLLKTADDPTPFITTAAWHGHIVDQPRGAGGFGYDPHFVVEGIGGNGQPVTSAELPAAEKNRLSHRGQAVRQLVSHLKNP